MRTKLLTLLSILSLLVIPALQASADATYEPTTESLFTYNPNATDCAPKDGLLVDAANEAGRGCGYIYGGPFGEVDGIAKDNGAGEVLGNVRTYTTESSIGDIRLDGSRTVSGVVTVTSRESACASPAANDQCVAHDGVGGGIGQVVVDLAFGGLAADAPMFSGPAELSTTRVDAIVLPGQVSVEIPYELEIPASADGTSFQSLYFSTDVRGLHMGTGYAATDGSTTVDIPSLTPIDE